MTRAFALTATSLAFAALAACTNHDPSPDKSAAPSPAPTGSGEIHMDMDSGASHHDHGGAGHVATSSGPCPATRSLATGSCMAPAALTCPYPRGDGRFVSCMCTGTSEQPRVWTCPETSPPACPVSEANGKPCDAFANGRVCQVAGDACTCTQAGARGQKRWACSGAADGGS